MKETWVSETSVVDIYGGELVEPSHLAYPTSVKDCLSFLAGLESYKQEGAFVGYVDGAYDVPTENHIWSLRDCRHRLAEQHFGDKYRQASDQEKWRYMASDKIALIVTVDANQKVATKKSFKPDKGNIARPVYDWKERANRIAGLTIPNGKGQYRPLVDLVTVDGDPGHKGCPLESHFTLGAFLASQGILGAWLLYSWHEEWFEQAKSVTEKYIVMSEAVYAIDRLTKERASSTAIIERIKDGKR